MYIKLTDGQPQHYSTEQLRRDNPQVSFPSAIPDATLAEYGVYPLAATARPVVDHTKRVLEDTPVLIDGTWQQAWRVEDLTPDELAVVVQGQWAAIRKERNAKLAACDWTQLADAPADALQWAVYRQALRDITVQDDPFNIVWPAEPA
jgi:hypothetical protein